MNEEANVYVHLDWHIGAYGKVLMDEVFGEENFVNEVIWRYEGPQSPSDYKFATKHETIFRYSKGGKPFVNELWYFIKIPESKANFQKDEKGRWFFTIPKGDYSQESIKKLDKEGKIFRAKNGGVRIKCFVEKTKDGYFLQRKKIPDVWSDIPSLGLVASKDEVANYTTQKPEGLLERIIKASSDKGMVVADFFVGSGTTAKVANDLNRKFIACDIGINAVQTTRDRLVKAGAEFDVLKVRDGLRLFRNPAQTTARLFGLIDGFKTSAELGLGSFWDGGIINDKGSYEPVKFIGIDKNLNKGLLDIILEEIYRLEDTETGVSKVKLVYAYKDLDIDQSYVNKEIRKTGKTNIEVGLISLDDLLEEKRDMLYSLDNADIEVKKQDNQYRVEIKKYFSPYLKAKIDEYNAKKVKKGQRELELENKDKKEEIKISDTGLELIEAVQFDTTLKNDVWTSNLELEDKAGIKEKIKGVYLLKTDRFNIKIRNIVGDEIIMSAKDL
jgi:adenine-specific DNA-methyltransferase